MLLGSRPAGNNQFWYEVTSLDIATSQGPFAADPSFGLVTDKGVDTYDPDTFYVSDGRNLKVTKNHGVTWATRTPNTINAIADIAVDPRNRDYAFVVDDSVSMSAHFRHEPTPLTRCTLLNDVDSNARVENVDVRYRSYTGEYSDFRIVE